MQFLMPQKLQLFNQNDFLFKTAVAETSIDVLSFQIFKKGRNNLKIIVCPLNQNLKFHKVVVNIITDILFCCKQLLN